MTKGESNKSTIEQELTAIHWAITYFKPYLYGRYFTVLTDHKPLVYLYSLKDPSSKLARMRLDLREFSFGIDYVKGKDNVGPDALSRIIINSEDLEALANIYVTTRARSKINNTTDNMEHTGTKIDHLKAYDSITNLDAFKLPKLTFKIKQDCIEVFIKSKNLKGELAMTQVHPSKGLLVCLKECIQSINNMAKKLRIKTIALSNADPLFQNISRDEFKSACNNYLSDVTIIFYQPAQIIKCQNEIKSIIEANHETPSGGHVGINKLIQKLRRNYYWTNMKSSITNFVKNCISCKINKHAKNTKEVYEKSTTPIKAFDLISIDTVGPFTRSSKGNRYALTVQCDLTKYIVTIPLIDKQANTLAKAFVENVILIYGCPKTIKSDMGTEYKNEVFHEVCKELNINQKFSTAYHPETIGALERSHRCLNEFLRQFINEQHDDWDSWLPYYSFCYNTTPHTEHSYAPFELIFGTQPNFPKNVRETTQIDPLYNHEAYYKELKYKLQTAALKAKDFLEKSKENRIQQQNKTNSIKININDTVWLKKENRRKLDPVYSGPFQVIEIKHPNVKIKHKLYKDCQIVHKKG